MATDAAVSSAGNGPSLSVATLFYPVEAAARVRRWQDRFRLEAADAPPAAFEGAHLWAAPDGLTLRVAVDGRVDSLRLGLEEVTRRARQGDELLRACGVSSGRPMEVFDPLAGWGVDGLVLASRGCRVTLVERNPVVATMQEDLVQRSGASAVICRCGDGFRTMAEAAAGGCDVVYLDPMFPDRRKGALPGKRMQWLARLSAPDPRPLTQWLDVARRLAGERVVLKRRRTDPPVARPDWQIVGRSVRYDVFRSVRRTGSVVSQAGSS